MSKRLKVFQKEITQPIYKHIKRCSNELIIREMQMKTKMRFYFTPTRLANIKNSDNTKYQQE